MSAVVVLTLFAVAAFPARGADEPREFASNWHQWRGPDATGAAGNGNPPTAWGEGQNVRWKVEIPGKGHASPIVWGDRIYVLTAIAGPADPQPEQPEPADGKRRRRRRIEKPTTAMKFSVLAIARGNGATVWERVVREEVPHEGSHPAGTWASGSPITDGAHIFAHFGSRGLFCLDMSGSVIWERDLGDMTTRRGFGEGSSPALAGDLLVVNWDHEGESFIIALNKKTGAEKWRAERDESTSWATPLIVEVDGRQQVIVNATNHVRSYDLLTGEVVWQSSGMTTNVIPSPMAAAGVAYLTSGFRGSALQAIRLGGARGDLDGTESILWSRDSDTPYIPSALLYDGMFYMLKRNSGLLTCLDAKTGKEHFSQQRLTGVEEIHASPVGAGGRVYIPSTNGTTIVIRRGSDYELLAENVLDDAFSASPAIVGDEIYLRGHRFLYCLAESG